MFRQAINCGGKSWIIHIHHTRIAGMSSVVTKDVISGDTVIGNPAHQYNRYNSLWK